MKRIKTSAIAPGAAMPFKGGMLDLMQDNVKEVVSDLQYGETKQTSLTPVILYGDYTLAGGTYTISAGAMMYLGEIYRWDAINVTPALGQVVIGTITEVSQSGAGLDPVTFSNAASNNVNMSRIIVWSAGTSGSGTFNLSACTRYFGGYYPVTYSAGKLTASTGAWTLPGGASDFYVGVSFIGSKINVKFRIVNGTLSLATANIRFDIDFETAINLYPVRRSVGYAFLKNSNNTPTQELARVVCDTATNNRIYIERVGGANIAAITGGLDVEGEITFECDFGFN